MTVPAGRHDRTRPGWVSGGDWESTSVETRRLLLRRWDRRDAGDLRAACQDAELHRWLRLPDPYLDADAEDWVTTAGHAHRRARTGLDCAVVEQTTRRLAGSASIRLDRSEPTTAQLACWTAPWARRQGYAAEATDALTRWAGAQGVVRTEMRTPATNIAAQRVALRAGFFREGMLRAALRDGQWDAVLFARLTTDPGLPAPRPLPDLDMLTDGTVAVRPLREGDEDGLLDERTDPESQRWAISNRPWTWEDVTRLTRTAASTWLAGGEARLAVVDVASGELAGTLSLRMTAPGFALGELGYGMRPAWRRRGLMSRALRLVARWAFDEVGLARLELGTAVGNLASQRTAERAGFRREGVARFRLPTADGGRADELRYGLTRDDLESAGRGP